MTQVFGLCNYHTRLPVHVTTAYGSHFRDLVAGGRLTIFGVKCGSKSEGQLSRSRGGAQECPNPGPFCSPDLTNQSSARARAHRL